MNSFEHTRREFIKTISALGGTVVITNIIPQAAHAADAKSLKDYMNDRISAVYAADGKFKIRASQDNLQVKKLYEKFLGKPGGQKAHQFLHMHFTDRSKNIKRLGDKAINPRGKEFEGQPYPYE